MSIFKDTFKKEIQTQLEIRQNAILNRTPTTIKYLNSRNAWIKMSSSVNASLSPGTPPTNDLADNYQLKGGVLSPQGLRSGVVNLNNTNAAYDNSTPLGESYQRGIRPMPGITTIDIKSKSTYGSLREVVVNFQCWDIKQLEDLELLYMRPGYTVLVEWGWLPYLPNKGSLVYNTSTYDIIKQTPSKEKIWKDIFEKSINSGGNYDATFGYVKNYSWSARPDGGYDCSTTIISIGEILESLKVNYTPLNIRRGLKGLISKEITPEVADKYKKNILAGLFAELYENVYKIAYTNSNSIFDYNQGIFFKEFNFFIRSLNLTTYPEEENLINPNKDIQIYITLDGLVKLFNKYIILQENNKPIVELSLQDREYLNEDKKILKDLLCLAHPLQLSIDPTVCYIKSPVWANIQLPSSINENEGDDYAPASYKTNYYETLNQLDSLAEDNKETELIKKVKELISIKNPNIAIKIQKLKDQKFNEKEINEKLPELIKAELEEINNQSLSSKHAKTLYTLLNRSKFSNKGISDSEINDALENNDDFIQIIKDDLYLDNIKRIKDLKEENKDLIDKANKKNKYLENKNVKNFFLDGNQYSELGTIANIYVSLQYLYNLSLDTNLESQDKKEKQEISAYDFLKSVMTGISNSIGNINNFDIHIDPIDSKARIIDINYVDSEERKKVYENAFTLEMQNLKSTVRSYKLESQIFQDQSTIVAIGAQVQGGALGTDSNTLVDFNRGLIDRILPTKIDPTLDPNQGINERINEQLATLLENLQTIYTFLGDRSGWFIFTGNAKFDSNSASTYSGALRDLISYFKSLTDSTSKNRSIIPTKLSVEMDGIGGLVIGHIFKIPNDLLPKGYKGEKLGSKLGHIVTGIGHNIIGNDWVTNIDAQTIILDDPHAVGNDPQKKIKELINDFTSGDTTPIILILKPIDNTGKGSVVEDSKKYPVLLNNSSYKDVYNSYVQKEAIVLYDNPVANSLRTLLDKNYIIEKGNELSSNGDITESLKTAVLNFQNKIKNNKEGFKFVNSTNPIVITAGNDTYHRTYGEHRNRTTHSRGLAIDIRTKGRPNFEINSIMIALKESGFTYIDYHGGSFMHIHANINPN